MTNVTYVIKMNKVEKAYMDGTFEGIDAATMYLNGTIILPAGSDLNEQLDKTAVAIYQRYLEAKEDDEEEAAYYMGYVYGFCKTTGVNLPED